MSMDLTVKLRHAVALTSLLAATHRICCQILDLPTIPRLQAYVLEDGGNRHPIQSGFIADGGHAFGITMADGDAGVALVVIDIPEDPHLTPEESGVFVGIVADARPLVSALAASSAIALAQLTGSSVVDDGREWTTIFEQSPHDFAAAVRVAGPFEDVWEAADAFAAALQQRIG